ncbi:hypothetical protein I4U23_009370 [Adineta vaga]|nr:hypothetical protein I4U23_009370 [Adineta vaga]
MFHERVSNKHTIHSSRPPADSNTNTNQMIVTHVTPVIEQTSRYQHRLSIKSLTTSFDRFPSWNNIYTRKTSSASTFCGEIINDLPVCIDRRQSTFHSTSYPIRKNHHQKQKQQQQQHRLFSLTQPQFNSSSNQLPITLTITPSRTNNANKFQQSVISLSKNPTNSSINIDDQSRFTNQLSITRLVPTVLTGSYDHLLTNSIDISLSTSSDIISQRSSSSGGLSPGMTISKTTSANLYYIPASDSLVYDNLAGTRQSTIISSHQTNSKSKNRNI